MSPKDEPEPEHQRREWYERLDGVSRVENEQANEKEDQECNSHEHAIEFSDRTGQFIPLSKDESR